MNIGYLLGQSGRQVPRLLVVKPFNLLPQDGLQVVLSKFVGQTLGEGFEASDLKKFYCSGDLAVGFLTSSLKKGQNQVIS